MADWPMMGVGRILCYGGDTGDSYGLDITTGAANTKGNWYEACASIPSGVCGVCVNLLHGGYSEYLYDLGIGAEGSETAIIHNMPRQNQSSAAYRLNASFLFPIALPAGERLSLRAQATSASKGCAASVILLTSSFLSHQPAGKVFTYGANTADSGGTSIDPGESANTKPVNYTEISSSVDANLSGIIIAVAGNGNGSRSEYGWLLDVAIGSAGNEVNIVENYCLNCHQSNDYVTPAVSFFMPVSIPDGSRLSARAVSSAVASLVTSS